MIDQYDLHDLYDIFMNHYLNILFLIDEQDRQSLRHVCCAICAVLPGDVIFGTLRITLRQITSGRSLSEKALKAIGKHYTELRVSFRDRLDEGLSSPGAAMRDHINGREIDVVPPEGAVLLDNYFDTQRTPPLRVSSHFSEYVQNSDWPSILKYLPHLTTLAIQTVQHPGGISFTPVSLMLISLRIGFEQATFLRNITTMRLAPVDITYLTHFNWSGPGYGEAHWTAEKTWGRIKVVEIQVTPLGEQKMDTNQWIQTVKLVRRWLRSFSRSLQVLKFHWVDGREGVIPHPLFLEKALSSVKQGETPIIWSEMIEFYVGYAEAEEDRLLPSFFSERTPKLESYFSLRNVDQFKDKLLAWDIDDHDTGEDWACIDVQHVLRLNMSRVAEWLTPRSLNHNQRDTVFKTSIPTPIRIPTPLELYSAPSSPLTAKNLARFRALTMDSPAYLPAPSPPAQFSIDTRRSVWPIIQTPTEGQKDDLSKSFESEVGSDEEGSTAISPQRKNLKDFFGSEFSEPPRSSLAIDTRKSSDTVPVKSSPLTPHKKFPRKFSLSIGGKKERCG